MPSYLRLDDEGVQPNDVGVIGASSFVGTCLLPLLINSGWRVKAFSRSAVESCDDGVVWRRLPLAESPSIQPSRPSSEADIPHWICLAPLWVLPEYFTLLEAYGVRRIVVLSSTSRFTKEESSDQEEQVLAQRLAKSEALVMEWAESRGIDWVILRPTLIYGLGQDKNIAEIARIIHRFGFFPLFGRARGLRQPIHVQDVANACLEALQMPSSMNKAYNISGAETLSYRDMVVRIFVAMGRNPLLVSVPLFIFRIAVALLRYLPRYRHWSVAMAERMNCDLVFEHSEAERDLAFIPRAFVLSERDVLAKLNPEL